jgi:hypothetical protein
MIYENTTTAASAAAVQPSKQSYFSKFILNRTSGQDVLHCPSNQSTAVQVMTCATAAAAVQLSKRSCP